MVDYKKQVHIIDRRENMSLFKEYIRIMDENKRRENEILYKIMSSEAGFTSLQKDVFQRQCNGESVYEIAEHTNLSVKGVHNTMVRNQRSFERWLEKNMGN